MRWLKKIADTPLDTTAKVVDSLAQQANSTTNAPSIRAVNAGILSSWEHIYPVGCVYYCVGNFDPSAWFGGTWQQLTAASTEYVTAWQRTA